MTIGEAAAALRSGSVSSVELTTSALERIQRLDPKLNSFLTVTADKALRDARAADEDLRQGRDRGPLQGIPIALKDLFLTKGVRTTAGSTIYEHFVPEIDAAVAEKFAAAGAVLIGKLNMHELAYGITSAQSAFWPRAQSLEHRAYPGRVERRFRRCGRRGVRVRGDGQRHRRLDPDSGVVLRHVRN